MIKTEQLPGLWNASVPEGEVLSGVGARAPAPYSGFTFKTEEPNKAGQRTVVSRLARRQIERQRRLAPVADFCILWLQYDYP